MSPDKQRRQVIKTGAGLIGAAAVAGRTPAAVAGDTNNDVEDARERNNKAMDLIGNTPLVKLRNLADGDSADVFVKFEGANPTGSMKDRMALSMIEGAERRGDLRPGGRVVEYTGGSTGSSLAMVCATRGQNVPGSSISSFALAIMRSMTLAVRMPFSA